MGPVGTRHGLERRQEALEGRLAALGMGLAGNGEARSIGREPTQVKGSSWMKEGTPPRRRHALRVLPRGVPPTDSSLTAERTHLLSSRPRLGKRVK